MHRGGDLPEGFHGQPLFNDIAGTEVERARAGHRKVVHRAVHSQGAEVAAGEEERAHDIGVGGERQALPADLEHAGVVLRFEHRVAERGQE